MSMYEYTGTCTIYTYVTQLLNQSADATPREALSEKYLPKNVLRTVLGGFPESNDLPFLKRHVSASGYFDAQE